MTPSHYEEIVADIASGIQKGAPDLSDYRIGYGSRNRIQGASGYRHQIDVSLIGPNEIYLIECKLWGRKVGVGEVLTLAARVADVRDLNQSMQVQCILASNAGLTRGAKKIAAHFEIQVEAVKSASEFGFKLGKNIHLGFAEAISVSAQVTAIKLSRPEQSKE